MINKTRGVLIICCVMVLIISVPFKLRAVDEINIEETTVTHEESSLASNEEMKAIEQNEERASRALSDWEMTTDDGAIYIGDDSSGNQFQIDIPTYVTMKYVGRRVIDGPITYSIEREDGILIVPKQSYVPGDKVSLEGLSDGIYYLDFFFKTGRTFEASSVYLNIERIDVDIEMVSFGNEQLGYLNPSELKDISNDSSLATNWIIKNKTSATELNGIGNDDLETTLKSLDEGSYTHTVNVNKTTRFGSLIESNKSIDFIIRHPEATTALDRTVNPQEITGTQKLGVMDSTLTWEIRDESGIVLYSGNDSVIGNDILDLLAEGSYTVAHIETDIVTNELSEATSEFIIRHPQSSVYIDNPLNPNEIIGSQKLDPSVADLTWRILDVDGILIDEGTESTISKEIIDSLKDGLYSVEFIETDNDTGEMSISKGQFEIARTISSPQNPKNTDDIQTGVLKETFMMSIALLTSGFFLYLSIDRKRKSHKTL